jgi:hypothetical protein
MLPVIALWADTGCMGPSYTEVSRIDTIEAYEEFLTNDPDSAYRNPV